MEVILRNHVEHLGRRGDIVTVANGYARNYLLPQKLALQVTEANKRQVERERSLAEAREAEERVAAEAVASRMAGLECTIVRRVGQTGTLYGSVTSADIAEAFEGAEVEISKKQIRLREAIKSLGAFPVPIKLHHDVTAEVVVNVVAEGYGSQVAAPQADETGETGEAEVAAASAGTSDDELPDAPASEPEPEVETES
ncbi:MAG: 50S ribosomal protein L9 [Acidobacteria bacterium]|nr:50S ribosomal protein L9 [Acidobacteriota bacterium]MYJ06182.1 50S ribosomal protein L9 [Acidobacteriota bacterium]